MREKELYPEKFEARRIARKNIKRTECIITGCNELGERHHPDYSKPLDIIPLCGEHHREEERRIRV